MRHEKPLPALARCSLFTMGCALFLVFSACSRSEPRIPYGVIRLVYYQGSVRAEERFSFFIIAEDDDGIENIDALYLYHDREGLCWLLTHEDWVTFEEEGATWIGSRSIAMPGNEGLPRGQFRAVLVNKGGERTERTFSFDLPANPRYPFPSFTIREGQYMIDSKYPENFFICYDGEGNYLQTLPVVHFDGPLSNMGLPPSVRSVALWAEDTEYYIAALTSVSPIR
ncbi:MAG: hypothetical protein LBT14_07905 [Treponema sp.]|nr:hypothetical protein [Treponema sp.]